MGEPPPVVRPTRRQTRLPRTPYSQRSARRGRDTADSGKPGLCRPDTGGLPTASGAPAVAAARPPAGIRSYRASRVGRSSICSPPNPGGNPNADGHSTLRGPSRRGRDTAASDKPALSASSVPWATHLKQWLTAWADPRQLASRGRRHRTTTWRQPESYSAIPVTQMGACILALGDPMSPRCISAQSTRKCSLAVEAAMDVWSGACDRRAHPSKSASSATRCAHGSTGAC